MSPDEQTYRDLKALEALLAPEGAWTTGTYARNTEGIAVNPRAPDAVCFCLSGASYRLIPRDENMRRVRLRDELITLSIEYGAFGSLPAFNDAQGRTKAEVLVLIRGAQLRVLERSGQHGMEVQK